MIVKKRHRVNNTVEIIFEVDRGDADAVALVCDVEDWQPTPMRRANRGKGPFRAKLVLGTGEEAHFRYLVNGEEWLDDPGADDYVSNAYGGVNGVVRAS